MSDICTPVGGLLMLVGFLMMIAARTREGLGDPPLRWLTVYTGFFVAIVGFILVVVGLLSS